MGVTKKGRCVKTQFNKEILCAGSMQDLVEVLKRVQGTTEVGESIESSEIFTLVADFAGYLEASKATRRFNGVSMEDQSAPNFTHAGYIPFDQDVYELDVNSFFVRLTRDRSRYFKLKAIKNFGEQDEYLQLQLAETGFDDIKASFG